jgi:hypothetical protein
VRPAEILVGDRRKHHELRRIDAVVFLGAGVLDEVIDVLLESVEAGGPGMGLVRAKKREDDVGLRAREFEPVFADEFPRLQVARFRDRRGPREPLVGRAEILAPQSLGRVDLVAVDGEIADHEPVLGKPAVKIDLEPARVLHPVGNTAADDADVVAFLKIEPGGVGRHGRGEDGRDRSDPGSANVHRDPVA